MVNVDALKARMKEKDVTFEDLSAALNVPLWKARRFVLGSLDMYMDQAEKIQEVLEIEDRHFGYYFFYDNPYSLAYIK